MSSGDTIVALSSGSPPSGVAIIRVSGPATRMILKQVAGVMPEPRVLTLRPLEVAGTLIDHGLVAFFAGPHSFTGEDVAELQVHGSPAVVKSLLRALTALPSVRLAEAGEFTRRAFLSGKLDLVETEGLGDLIAAETEGQLRLAQLRANGALSGKLEGWRVALLGLRAEIEARLDFSDEGDVDDELPADFAPRVAALRREIEDAVAGVSSGRIIREGLRVVLVGAPNAGKSSLLNALAGSDIAIVTDEPGTTRDIREVPLNLGGRLVVLIDTAGLRDAEGKAESEGVRRAYAALEQADLILHLKAPDVDDVAVLGTAAPLWTIGTKLDVGGIGKADLSLSSVTGEGIPLLLDKLTAFADAASGQGSSALFSHERDREALLGALDGLSIALSGNQSEIAAEGLRRAGQSLERLLGRIETEDVLDVLFSRFCIGK